MDQHVLYTRWYHFQAQSDRIFPFRPTLGYDSSQFPTVNSLDGLFQVLMPGDDNDVGQARHLPEGFQAHVQHGAPVVNVKERFGRLAFQPLRLPRCHDNCRPRLGFLLLGHKGAQSNKRDGMFPEKP